MVGALAWVDTCPPALRGGGWRVVGWRVVELEKPQRMLLVTVVLTSWFEQEREGGWESGNLEGGAQDEVRTLFS